MPLQLSPLLLMLMLSLPRHVRSPRYEYPPLETQMLRGQAMRRQQLRGPPRCHC
jgi:hypothetical protein